MPARRMGSARSKYKYFLTKYCNARRAGMAREARGHGPVMALVERAGGGPSPLSRHLDQVETNEDQFWILRYFLFLEMYI